MTTIYDIAKKTGFSITTVSRALNNYTDVSPKTKKLILEAVEDMHYYPNSVARTLSTKKSWALGIIFVEDLGIGMKHPFFNSVIEGFKKSVEQKGYDLIFLNRYVGGEKMTYLDHALHRGVDGIAVVSSNYDDVEVEKIIGSSLPNVIIDSHTSKSNVVYSDNMRGSELAVDYLYSLGHRNIAHISGHSKTFVGLERLRGFKSAVEKYQLHNSSIAEGGLFSVDGGYQAMKTLLQLENRPTAIFAAGDNLAIGAMKAIKDAGLNVPDDFSIIGFDDIELSGQISPSLTTIKQDMDKIGEQAAELLLQQINHKTDPTISIVPVELIKRETTKAIK
ncbi:LacI family transcriptional regulator [Salipaludibacillus keqinensis]|uniref:LacI family transcriptional regulator n=1 Tax=Salipaludibacillus keqinensis TaxID=2045207 RepID=A0A323TDG0_9BACI|nr:LacI family DNA-binding transcriptional regulator [Salipaludibacillus keqinensis]PYZ92676.1 LacI family transcriptional regulator [Salipaludibacillus keqinensis]